MHRHLATDLERLVIHPGTLAVHPDRVSLTDPAGDTEPERNLFRKQSLLFQASW